MDNKSFEFLYNDAKNALYHHQLIEALTCLNGILYNIDDVELHNEKDSICKDYDVMLNFFSQGWTDEGRIKVFQNLTNRSHTLLDRAARRFRLKSGKDLYTITSENLLNTDNPDVNLFNNIWTSDIFKTTDSDRLDIQMKAVDTNCQLQAISAIMLNILEYFDVEKVKIIIRYCQHDDTRIRARAIVALIWIIMKYEQQFLNYTELQDAINLIGMQEKFRSEITILQKELLLSLETANIGRRLQKEILPDLLKDKNPGSPNLDFTFVDEDLSASLFDDNINHANPEQRKLSNKMKELVELGREGVDINIGTFMMLKSFTFFQQTANWFAPFNQEHPEVKHLLSTSNTIQLLIESGNFCDSDKYSLCIMVSQMPTSQREIVLSQLSKQFEGNEEVLRESPSSVISINKYFRSYLQDLYRFYTIHPNKHEFDNPFKRDCLLTNYTSIKNILVSSPTYYKDMAPMLIKRNRYDDAINYIMLSADIQFESLQKLAYCHQQLGNYSSAIQYYKQADLIQADNEWNLKQMCHCYSVMHRYDDELKCLKKIADIHPNDTHISSKMAKCLMKNGQYETACQYYYELEYKGINTFMAQRAIAWCNLKLNNLQQSEKYYRLITENTQTSWTDYMNYGHVLWALDKRVEAIECYKKYISLIRKEKKTDPLHSFDKDRKDLLGLGLSEIDIDLMRDTIARIILYNEDLL